MRTLLAAAAPLVVILGSLALLPGSSSSFTDDTDATASFATTDDALLFLTGSTASAHLLWWFDGAETGTQFSDTGCTTAAIAGNPVRCWRDRRPGQGQLTVPTGEVAPTQSASTVNGHRAVRLTNGAILTGIDKFGGTTSSSTVFLVLRENARVRNFLLSLGPPDLVAPGRFTLNAPWDNGLYYFDFGNAGTHRVQTTRQLTSVGDTTLLVGWQEGTQGTARNYLSVNGDTFFSSSSGAITTGPIKLGHENYPPNHDVAEILIFDQALSATDQAKISSYLTMKWNTPIIPERDHPSAAAAW